MADSVVHFIEIIVKMIHLHTDTDFDILYTKPKGTFNSAFPNTGKGGLPISNQEKRHTSICNPEKRQTSYLQAGQKANFIPPTGRKGRKTELVSWMMMMILM